LEGHKADAFNQKVATGFQNQGWAVAMVNYRLSPEVKFPVYLEDAAAAIHWVIENARAQGFDPARIYVGGHSAGGYLALLSILDGSYLERWGNDSSQIAGILSLSAQTLTHSTILTERDADKSRFYVDSAAPMHFAAAKGPPILLLCGDADVPARLEENALFAAIRRSRGNAKTIFEVIPGRDHMGIIENAGVPEDPVALAIQNFTTKAQTP
jgi:acetyl esterase/lipase